MNSQVNQAMIFDSVQFAEAILLHALDSDAALKKDMQETGMVRSTANQFERDAMKQLVADALARGVRPEELVLQLAERAVDFAPEMHRRRGEIAASLMFSAQAVCIEENSRGRASSD
ncbi:hypothetical protein [Prescottella agglutinans]|uniref:hypothetical protein n=1 Tax=Prescottella agglutinans TaxID=1644129 RepID=UPI003D96291B